MADFPFEEIRTEGGDLFPSLAAAKDAGFDEDQIWSVVEGDEGTWVYGPPHHYVNLLGFVCTQERHDHDTYFEESE